ncbi:hypothetical protein C8Q79DRAFT_927267 [Trametes meyenii]|nr:hypothetical protein C8Q79DRAFT_927267 [Trametes meyenii]
MVATQQLLQDPKITTRVLQFLDPGSVLEDGTGRGECQWALAQLAIVCRATSSPALDVLWRSVDAFEYLLFAFKPYKEEKLRFDDDITDGDWSRFQEYASRVRELHMGSEIPKIHANVWTTLTRRCLDKPLLPSLQRLTGLKLDAMSMCYTMLFSSTIKHLALETDAYSDAGAIGVAAKLVMPILGRLTSLVVDDKYYADNEERQAVSVWTLTHLHALTVKRKATLTVPIVQALATFPHLRQLTLDIKSIPSASDTQERIAGFDQLRELSLSGSVTNVSAFLTFVAPLHLESLEIISQQLCHDQQGPPMERRLEKAFSKLPPSLRRIQVSLQCACNRVHFEDGEKLFQPLRPLHALQRLEFAFHGVTFSLKDRLLRALTDAWPNLSVFEVATRQMSNQSSYKYSRYDTPPLDFYVKTERVVFEDVQVGLSAYNLLDHVPPTIPTLAAFVGAHAHLERLVLPSIDLDAVPDIASVPLLDHALKTIEVCELDAGVPLLEFALALDLLFPNLDLADARRAVARGRDESARTDELRLLLLALRIGRTGAYRADAAKLARDAEITVTRQGKYAPPAPPAGPSTACYYAEPPGPSTILVRPSFPGHY